MKRIKYNSVLLLLLFSSCFSKNHIEIEDNGNWVKLEDGKSIDGYTRAGNLIYGGYLDILAYFEPMSEVDVQTFEVCVGSGYARDKKHVYYPLWEVCEDGEDYGGCYFKEYIVKKAKPKTFKYLKDGYAIDKNYLFYNGKKINNAIHKPR